MRLCGNHDAQETRRRPGDAATAALMMARLAGRGYRITRDQRPYPVRKGGEWRGVPGAMKRTRG
jgi:hypothetical protein